MAPGHPVPQWYLLLDGETIAGGAGVIENDFHDRPDLAPNLCALFVEPEFRGRGLARALLDAVRADLAGMGVETLYLVTDHTEFYERCGWQFVGWGPRHRWGAGADVRRPHPRPPGCPERFPRPVILSAAKDLLFPSPPGPGAAEKILRRLTPPQDDRGGDGGPPRSPRPS